MYFLYLYLYVISYDVEIHFTSHVFLYVFFNIPLVCFEKVLSMKCREYFLCFLLWEKNISKCFSSAILSILSSAYGVGFERRCIGDKPDVQYHYFYKSCSRLLRTYIIGWTVSRTEQLSIYSVYFCPSQSCSIRLENIGLTYTFWGTLPLTNDSCLALLRLGNSNDSYFESSIHFDQRHVVWRYYDKTSGESFFLSILFFFDQRHVVWRYLMKEWKTGLAFCLRYIAWWCSEKPLELLCVHWGTQTQSNELSSHNQNYISLTIPQVSCINILMDYSTFRIFPLWVNSW